MLNSVNILQSKIDITNLLQENVLSVVFLKKDGSERVMECTLKADLLPVHETNTDLPTQTRAENPDVIRVYDLENSGWRSFRTDSVLAFMIRENYGN